MTKKRIIFYDQTRNMWQGNRLVSAFMFKFCTTTFSPETGKFFLSPILYLSCLLEVEQNSKFEEREKTLPLINFIFFLPS